MNPFISHHQDSIRFGYSCFDRVMLHGYIMRLHQPGSVIWFLKNRRQAPNLTRRYFSGISHQYHQWVEDFARQQGLDILEPDRDVRREEFVEPYYQKLQGQPGIAVLLKCREPERIAVSYAKQGHKVDMARRWANLYYFYLQDAQAGRMFLRICPYFPFNIAVWMNGHEWLANQLRREGIAFKKSDNCFLDCADPQRLQALADAWKPQDIDAVVQAWLTRLLPFFSAQERRQGYRHQLYMAQMEYCHNLLFHQRRAPDRLLSRLMDLNREIGRPGKLAIIFGRSRFTPDTRTGETVLKVTQLRTPVISTGFNKTFIKQYVKDRELLRTETTSCQLSKDLSVNKNIQNLDKARVVLGQNNERYLQVQQDILETYLDRGQLEQLSQPSVSAQGRRTPGLRLDDPRLLAVLQALMNFVHLVGKGCFRTVNLLADVRTALGNAAYKLSQLRYDLGKLRGKKLVLRLKGTQSYQLTAEGCRMAILYLKLRYGLYGPLTAGIIEPIDADLSLPHRRQGRRDRLYVALDKALARLTTHFGIATQASKAQQVA
jgi:hypothetical protein